MFDYFCELQTSVMILWHIYMYILAVKNMKVWRAPDIKSNSSTVTATRMFHKLHL